MGSQLSKEDSNEVKVTMNRAKYHITEQVEKKWLAVQAYEPWTKATNYWFESDPGSGKSSVFGNLNHEISEAGVPCSMRQVDCGNLFEGEFSGIPVPQTDKDGRVKEVLKFIVDKHFPETPVDGDPDLHGLTWEEYYNDRTRATDTVHKKIDAIIKDGRKNKYYEYFTPGYMFLDEFNNIQSPTIKSELLKYCDGSKKNSVSWPFFPACWVVVAAGNGINAQSEDIQQSWGRQILERFVIYKLEPVYKEFVEYLSTKAYPTYNAVGFHPMVRAYLDEHPTFLCHHVESERASASPRSWEDVSNSLYHYDTKVNNSIIPSAEKYSMLQEDIQQLIGRTIAADFMIFFTQQQNIIKKEDLTDSRIGEGKNAEKYMKIPLMFKKYSLLNAAGSLRNEKGEKADKSDKKKLSVEDKFYILIDNATFLFGTSSKEFLVTFLLQVLNENSDLAVGSKGLSPASQAAMKEALMFRKKMNSK